MISGYECFKLYIPVKLHFTQKKFDVFKTPKVKNTGIEQYNTRRDKGLFEKIAKKFDEPRECVRYYVSNFAYGNNNFLYDSGTGNDNYLTWNKRRQSLSYIFEKDLNYMINLLDNNKFSINNVYQQLFELYIRKEITLETVVILDSFNGMINDLNKSEMNLIWGDEFLKLKKCERFIKFDKNKIGKLYDDFSNEILRNIKTISS